MRQMYSEIFLSHSEQWSGKRVALYGTGVIGTELLRTCKDMPIVGVYDRDLREGSIEGTKILDIKNIHRDGIQMIVIAAQPENIYTIYSRIYRLADEAGTSLYNIYGEDLRKLYGKLGAYFQTEMNCFASSRERLMQEIKKHDVISFDIFDTLLMRRVYEPHDVFTIVQNKALAEGLDIKCFYDNRVQAEINLLHKIPTLAELYDELQRLSGISETVKKRLMQMEIETEKQVIVPRREIVKIWKETIWLGKPVYLISDMYLPTELLKELLKENGIDGFKGLYNSCDFHKPKVNGLFLVFTKEVTGESYLHIGDHMQADGICAGQAGMDSFVIQKASVLCEHSSFREMTMKIQTWNERLLYGLFLSSLFNNPFCVDEDYRILVEHIDELVFCAVAPAVSSFVEWLKKLQEKEGKEILFSARDGWLIKKLMEENSVYHKGVYFYTSRMACLQCKQSLVKRENYRKYLNKTEINTKDEYLFFDLASSGTCLSQLTESFGLKLQGVFFYRYDEAINEKKHLKIESYLPEDPNGEFWRNYKFFELILTSDEPSLECFDGSGDPVFETEYRSAWELECMRRFQKIIKDFYKIYHGICDDSLVNSDFLNMTISALGLENSHVKDVAIEKLYLYDSYSMEKIKIFDVG